MERTIGGHALRQFGRQPVVLNQPLPQLTALQLCILPDPPHLFPLQVFWSDPLMNIVEMDPNEGLRVGASFPRATRRPG